VFDQFRVTIGSLPQVNSDEEMDGNLFLKQGTHSPIATRLRQPRDRASRDTHWRHTDGHGIPLTNVRAGPDGNFRQVQFRCFDNPYTLVGAPAGTKDMTGCSAHRGLATTLGDELVWRQAGGPRYGVSMKDRAGILTSGHLTRGLC